jgi:class 3 adenylate cyclase
MNLAARIEAVCEPMEILVSEGTYDQIRNEFRLSDFDEHNIRGFGLQKLYRLDGDFAPANDSA